MFNTNSFFLFAVATGVIVFVLAQSGFFLMKATQQAKIMGISMDTVKRTVKSSALFTIAPAISILLGVISLSKFLGLPLPWVRLSVIGSITYELTAAASAATTLGIQLANQITDSQIYTTIAWVMTLGIIPSIILIPLFLKKIQNGIVTMKRKDQKWGEYFITAMFMGMISTFLGAVFVDIRNGIKGWIPVFVLLSSAAIMAICGLLIKTYKWKWLEEYALPFSILGAMSFSIAITQWLI